MSLRLKGLQIDSNYRQPFSENLASAHLQKNSGVKKLQCCEFTQYLHINDCFGLDSVLRESYQDFFGSIREYSIKFLYNSFKKRKRLCNISEISFLLLSKPPSLDAISGIK